MQAGDRHVDRAVVEYQRRFRAENGTQRAAIDADAERVPLHEAVHGFNVLSSTPQMPKRTDLKSILIIGSGPIVIGQAVEFDYSGTQACKALKDEGYRIILV